ncbi:TetR/AcrR family transcriptional regulator [Nocardioides sp.]|uniref:TetR/AcrR family transcriptional regulator n=1 Tax=Nocardioides sp. TaxID=35761 RepID=UPI00272714FC|nr:TetR/AcrR family transcriptional regulator [Nocardioides sp.]MDO9456734.1 TetR/AcrR family transcriptional regulator [Nocardioides sp.]
MHQRVFDALAVLLTKRSFDAISMAQLAAAAGLGRTAIYHHFPDKEAVVVAFASHETTRYLEGLRAGLTDVEGPVERFRVYVRHQLEAGQQFHMGLGTQLYGALSRDSMLAIRDHVVEVEQVLQDLLAEGIASGDFTVQDEGATISLIHACLSPRDLPTEAVERFVLRALGAV